MPRHTMCTTLRIRDSGFPKIQLTKWGHLSGRQGDIVWKLRSEKQSGSIHSLLRSRNCVVRAVAIDLVVQCHASFRKMQISSWQERPSSVWWHNPVNENAFCLTLIHAKQFLLTVTIGIYPVTEDWPGHFCLKLNVSRISDFRLEAVQITYLY